VVRARRATLIAALAGATWLLGAAGARAADPILPLAEVAKGMRCQALSVLEGTEISAFDAEVVDVVAGDPGADAARILVRLSGPEIERTGVGQGFSGSPILCPGPDGVARIIGAISEGVGAYGGLLVLATPIEAILGEPVEPPASAPPAPAGARPLAAPISLAGVTPAVGRLFSAAAARAGRVLYAAPGGPRQDAFPWQPMRPGAAMAIGLASGDITAGAVGTVTYVDGDRVWALGHPFEGAGRRSLFLQDAYVYAVVGNPVASQESTTYKLAAPGHDVGTISGDGLQAVTGRIGVLPPRIPVRVVARDEDTGRRRVLQLQVADESALGLPTGTSALALVGSAALAQAVVGVLGSAPSRQTGELCVRIQLAQRRRPLRFCNRYVTRSASDEDRTLGVGAPMVGDLLDAVTAVDAFNFAALRITAVEMNVKVRRGLRQAFLLDVRAPRVVRRGRTARVRVRVQPIGGRARWRTVPVQVPRGIPRGRRMLTLSGTPADTAGLGEADLSVLFGEDGDADEAGPRTVAALAAKVAALGRYDGVRASFPAPGGAGRGTPAAERLARRARPVLRDPALRLSGTVRAPVLVR
jgi:hypothetical protein